MSETREPRYHIVRYYRRSYRQRTIRRNVYLSEAQRHCSDPQSSSTTCTSAAGRKRTQSLGPWFDGYVRA